MAEKAEKGGGGGSSHRLKEGSRQDGEAEGAEEPAEGGSGPAPVEAPLSSEDEAECRICYNHFDPERRAPKLLECLHTFCQECLNQLHLRAAQSPHRQAGGGGGGGGGGGLAGSRSSAAAAADPPAAGVGGAITCPLCRHRTALPDCRVHSLPINTKLAKGFPMSPPPPPLLPLQALKPARQRPHPEHGGEAAAVPGGSPLGAAVAAAAALATHTRAGPRAVAGGCYQRCKQSALNASWPWIVFSFLFVVLLFLAGFICLGWYAKESSGLYSIPATIFLTLAGFLSLYCFVAIYIICFPKFRPETAAALATAARGGGPSGPAAATVVAPRSRTAAGRRSRT